MRPYLPQLRTGYPTAKSGMWIQIFPVCLAGFILALFGYLFWLRPERFLRNWIAFWGAVLAWSVVLFLEGSYPATSLLRGAACLFILAVMFLPTGIEHLPLTSFFIRRSWFLPAVAVVAMLAVVFVPPAWISLPSIIILAGLGILTLLRNRPSYAHLVMGFIFMLWALLRAMLPVRVEADLLSWQTLPEILLALSMLLVLNERESQITERNLTGLSVLNLPDPELNTGHEIQNALERVLQRLEETLQTGHIALWTGPPFQSESVGVFRGFTSRFRAFFNDTQANTLAAIVTRHSGVVMIRDLRDPGRSRSDHELERWVEQIREEPIRGFVCVLLQAKSQPMGLLLVGRRLRRDFLPSELRFLLALSNQVAIALENLRLLDESRRRSGEFEILTHIGTALSSSLDQDALLRVIHEELQKLLDVRNFYVAFLDESRDEVQFALETEDGRILPKRRRGAINALTEHVIRTGKPLLISHDVAAYSQQADIATSGRNARCWAGVPIVLQGRPSGVIAVQNYEHENVYDREHLEILEIVAGQAGVAIDNARLFAEVQRDARQMSFLNQIARLSISTLKTQEMLQAVVSEIWKAFRYDSIGIGIINYRTRQLEFRAEAGANQATALHSLPSVPLESGIIGQAARTGEMVLVHDARMNHELAPLDPKSRSVLAIPIIYSGQTMGVINIESREPHIFVPDQVLVLQTLADQLAVAFNNALTFQQMQQQAITDSLTGLKTRRYFMEALNSELSRARRSGESFCVLVVDMNGFKQINDTLGHLEGDLVLARVARILEHKSRASSVVARYGGDEFTILIPGATLEQGRAVAQRLQVAIEQDPLLAERGTSASLGVGSFPDSGATPEDILRAADTRMYSAKKGVSWSTPPPRAASSRGVSEKVLLPLYALAQTIDAHRERDRDHSIRVADYARRVARRLDLSVDLQDTIQIAARLHDIGKSGFGPELFRSGPLSPAERAQIQEHPHLGAELLRSVGGMDNIADLVACHHERLDGSGFPQGLMDRQIPIGVRILSAVEEYAGRLAALPPDAEFDPRRVVQQLRDEAPGAFDPEVLRALAAEVDEGTTVNITQYSPE